MDYRMEAKSLRWNVNGGIRTDRCRESERVSQEQPLGRFSDAAQKRSTADVASDGRFERRRPGDHQQPGDCLQGEQLPPGSTCRTMRLQRAPQRAPPDALEPLVYLQRQVYGEHNSWPQFHERMVREKRVIIRITIENVGPKVR